MSAPFSAPPADDHGANGSGGYGGLFPSGPQSSGHPVPERPPLPRPERLNRNVLTVGAVLMGVLVLAAVILVPPSQPTADPQPPARGTSEQPTPETYLEQPAAYAAQRPGGVGMMAPQPAASTPAAPGTGPGYQAATAPADLYASAYPAYASGGEPGATSRMSEREAAYRAALVAPLVAGQGSGVVTADPLAAIPGYTLGVPGAAPSATAAEGGVPVGAGKVRAYSERPTVIATSVQPAPGPYALQAGTIIPAVLLTEINSDLPGDVLAQVSRDVFDSRSQQQLLVPKGSRLIGSYESEVTMSQERLFVRWTRLIFPDGRSVVLPELETKDRSGAAGVRDQVERHSKRNLGTAALVSLVSAGAQLSQPNGGYGPWGSPSAGQVVAGAAGQQLAEVTAQILRRNADAPPTLRVRQGMPFNVFLAADLTFPAPYRGAHIAGAGYAPAR